MYFDWSIPATTLHHHDHHPTANTTKNTTNTTQLHRIIPYQLSRIRSFAIGLLLPTLPFLCIANCNSDIDLKTYYSNRHLCSKKLLNRSLGLILHGLEKFSFMNSNEIIIVNKYFMLKSDQKDNKDDHHKGNHCSSSTATINNDDNDADDETSTPEIDLCTYGLDAFIILLQVSLCICLFVCFLNYYVFI
ncbi:unnamed protein product [Schistosoma mattheei]|uniref:Uncharacterized protein n=1 Tax=Schistosoma mattheei TaxID=31246 RepID=A0A183Q7R1_9TREM|nr:unnamed protein product [Schistosoma mattheei]